jgi:hypothetical protein
MTLTSRMYPVAEGLKKKGRRECSDETRGLLGDLIVASRKTLKQKTLLKLHSGF